MNSRLCSVGIAFVGRSAPTSLAAYDAHDTFSDTLKRMCLSSDQRLAQQFSIRIRTIVNMALDNSSRFLYNTLGTYN